jgi:hypothetical protein
MPQPIDEDPGKPVHIWTRTGCKPLLAGGNADGDAALLRTAWFGLLIRHDDRCGAPPGGTISGHLGAGVSAWWITEVKDFSDCPPAEGEARDRGTDGPGRA